MMAPEQIISQSELADLVGAVAVPCDFAADRDTLNPCPDDPAEWVLFVVPCCRGVELRLACDHCKNVRLEGEAAVECGNCGHVVSPARDAYFNVERLDAGFRR